VPDLSGPLQECLAAMEERRNLQDLLRRYAPDREELVALLRLSVDVGSLGAPQADPGLRLRVRNRMLAAAADRRRRRTFPALGRPVFRFAAAAAVVVGLMAGSLTAVAASGKSLPGDPLYPVKLGVERVQLATTFDGSARARLQLHFVDVRLDEAQRLFALGRVKEGVRLMDQYDSAVTDFNRSLAVMALDTRAANDLSRSVDDREARADASLKQLAGSLTASGDHAGAAAVARTQSHVDQSFRGAKQDLKARAAGQSGDSQPKPAGAQD
jgi:Domain of unknown function (DUF5667)